MGGKCRIIRDKEEKKRRDDDMKEQKVRREKGFGGLRID